jgi:hypothetical protein
VIPVRLVNGLRRAALERKLEGLKPDTQGALISLALEEWLEKEGVFKEG